MNAPLRLVIAPATISKPAVTIIVTTEPQLFEELSGAAEPEPVLVFDNAAEAFTALEKHKCKRFFADFRSLNDKWTGQRFLRHIKQSPGGEAVEFWLLANDWHTHQEQWVVQNGAAGFVARDTASVATKIGGPKPAQKTAVIPKSITESIVRTETMFATFAGPFAQIHIQASREALSAGEIAPTTDAYTADLASRLTVKSMRDEFLSRAKDTQPKK